MSMMPPFLEQALENLLGPALVKREPIAGRKITPTSFGEYVSVRLPELDQPGIIMNGGVPWTRPRLMCEAVLEVFLSGRGSILKASDGAIQARTFLTLDGIMTALIGSSSNIFGMRVGETSECSRCAS